MTGLTRETEVNKEKFEEYRSVYGDEDAILFWDHWNQDPLIMAEDGDFHWFNEDQVVSSGDAEPNSFDYPEFPGFSWFVGCSLTGSTPLNDSPRWGIFDPLLNEWVSFNGCDFDLIRLVQKRAGVKEWERVI